jgi:hypothetical protein
VSCTVLLSTKKVSGQQTLTISWSVCRKGFVICPTAMGRWKKLYTFLTACLLLAWVLISLAQILNVVAFQTNISLDSHTEHMKRLADSYHETGREVAELGRQSREDAIYMRYLAELTMVFLPLTAVSVSIYGSLLQYQSHAQINRRFSA